MVSINSPANTAARATNSGYQPNAASKQEAKTTEYDFTSLSEQKHEAKKEELNSTQLFFKRAVKIFNHDIFKIMNGLSPILGLGLLTVALSTGAGMLASLLYFATPILLTQLNAKALVPWLTRKNEELNSNNDAKVNLNQDLIFDNTTKQNLFYKIKQFLGYKSELQTENLAKAVGTGSGNLLILHGPPGTGKTAIAEGIAAIAKKPLIKVNVNDIESKWIGESESRIADKFKVAKKMGAYLFFDEADALLMPRSEDSSSGGAISQTKITNTFIQNFNEYANDVKVILATNTAGSLDNAIKSRAILCNVPAPNIDMQLAILYRKLADFGLSQERIAAIKTQETSLKELLAKNFAHFTGRDIEAGVKAAFFVAESRAKDSGTSLDFTIADLQKALENLNLEKERSESSELRVASNKEQMQKAAAFRSLLSI